MTLMNIRLELGRVRDFPQGDPRHGYEFVAPLDRHGHLDATAWGQQKQKCTVRSFRPRQSVRAGMFRHVGVAGASTISSSAKRMTNHFSSLIATSSRQVFTSLLRKAMVCNGHSRSWPLRRRRCRHDRGRISHDRVAGSPGGEYLWRHARECNRAFLHRRP